MRRPRRRASLEQYRHIGAVFERQNQFEADLIAAGFFLEAFTTVDTPDTPATPADTIH